MLGGNADRREAKVRVVLTWSHPEFHPTLWTNALGSLMPAPEGDVTLDSGSGNVTMTRVKGPRLTIDSGSGRVRAETITVDRLNIDSGSGSVDLRGVQSPDIVLDSGSG